MNPLSIDLSKSSEPEEKDGQHYFLRAQFLQEFLTFLLLESGRQRRERAAALFGFSAIKKEKTIPKPLPKPRPQNLLPPGIRVIAPAAQPLSLKQEQGPSFPLPPTAPLALPPPTGDITITALAKLELLLRNQSIKTIECPGPDRPVLISQNGSIQVTGIALSESEINTIMQEISEKTRIPVIPGVFKAALGNLIITAVISEFVGTRFIIQKNYPRPQLPQFRQPQRF